MNKQTSETEEKKAPAGAAVDAPGQQGHVQARAAVMCEKIFILRVSSQMKWKRLKRKRAGARKSRRTHTHTDPFCWWTRLWLFPVRTNGRLGQEVPKGCRNASKISPVSGWTKNSRNATEQNKTWLRLTNVFQQSWTESIR